MTEITPTVIRRLAHRYRDGAHCPPSADLCAAMQSEVMEMFNRIPVPVVWVQGGEPFDNHLDFCRVVEEQGILLAWDQDDYFSCVWGSHYKHLRVVHDWYGHVLGDCPFGVPGEWESFKLHRAQFSPWHLPYVFNETILANAYRDHFGKSIGWDKVVV